MYPGEEIARRFLVTRCDTSELFDEIEEVLDQIALATKREIAIALNFPVCLGRNDRCDGAPFRAADATAGVTAFLAEESSGLIRSVSSKASQ